MDNSSSAQLLHKQRLASLIPDYSGESLVDFIIYVVVNSKANDDVNIKQ
jgi:hypothetical protein